MAQVKGTGLRICDDASSPYAGTGYNLANAGVAQEHASSEGGRLKTWETHWKTLMEWPIN